MLYQNMSIIVHEFDVDLNFRKFTAFMHNDQLMNFTIFFCNWLEQFHDWQSKFLVNDQLVKPVIFLNEWSRKFTVSINDWLTKFSKLSEEIRKFLPQVTSEKHNFYQWQLVNFGIYFCSTDWQNLIFFF